MTAGDMQSTTSGRAATRLCAVRTDWTVHGGQGLCRVLERITLACALFTTACAGDAPVGPTPGSPSFDGNAAMEHVRTQVAFGPRVPGTQGHVAQLDWMLNHLGSYAPVVVADTFEYVTTNGDSLVLTNVMARFAPEETRRVLVLAHWDTRPTADEAADSADWGTPIAGANDGASGTAVLLAMAEMLSDAAPPVGVDLLFVDGEDYGPTVDDMLLGAKRYAETLSEDDRPVYGLLLDMVGDADPSFPVEGISAQAANVIVQKVWRSAERLGYRAYFPTAVGRDLTDDHVPLIQAGLPTANLIDFTYGPGNAYWHTLEDRVEHVSAATLGMVGAVVTELIFSGG
jgi:glutaminyl-peptide cyclotransferase